MVPVWDELFEQLARSLWRLSFDKTIGDLEAQQQAELLLDAVKDWEEEECRSRAKATPEKC